MAANESSRGSGTKEQFGHRQVTGTATIEPGTFHEPDQSRGSSGVATAARDVWGGTMSFLGRQPVLMLLAGVGLGFFLNRCWRAWADAR